MAKCAGWSSGQLVDSLGLKSIHKPKLKSSFCGCEPLQTQLAAKCGHYQPQVNQKTYGSKLAACWWLGCNWTLWFNIVCCCLLQPAADSHLPHNQKQKAQPIKTRFRMTFDELFFDLAIYTKIYSNRKQQSA